MYFNGPLGRYIWEYSLGGQGTSVDIYMAVRDSIQTYHLYSKAPPWKHMAVRDSIITYHLYSNIPLQSYR
jgi:hypothetical protein